MIPIGLDPAHVDTAVVGRGALALRRLAQLRTLGADPLVFSDAPDDALVQAARGRLVRRLPTRKDLRTLQAVWVAGLDNAIAAGIAADARAEKALVNVEDVLPFCDFHTPAIVQRGALLLTASTGGASPAAARMARETLEAAFPEDWSAAIDELAAARREARAAGVAAPLIMAQAQEILARRGLLPPTPPAH
ncbi:MAG: NAD(P)-dependent oxidoreductase [Hyphomonadaceae bacterium]|nr:NAD(P)-dependent oxidoreductase [Hyphomonadaceae bacterium]